jgi:hypothetical protein
MISCYMDGSTSVYFLMMDDMSPDYGTAMKSQGKTDIMEVSNNDLWRAYRAIGKVTECGGPYQRHYAHGGNEWVERTGSQPEMDRGRGWIAAGDGLWLEMDRGRRWIAAGEGLRPEKDCGRRWVTRDGSRPEMDRGRISIATGYGWITRSG